MELKKAGELYEKCIKGSIDLCERCVLNDTQRLGDTNVCSLLWTAKKRAEKLSGGAEQ